MFCIRGIEDKRDQARGQECVALLLAWGCDVAAVDSKKRSACDIAKEYGSAWAKEMIEAEIERRDLAKSVGVALKSGGGKGRPIL
jgi:hypothetical protein